MHPYVCMGYMLVNIYIYIIKAFEAPTIFHVSTVLKKKHKCKKKNKKKISAKNLF